MMTREEELAALAAEGETRADNLRAQLAVLRSQLGDSWKNARQLQEELRDMRSACVGRDIRLKELRAELETANETIEQLYNDR